MTCGRRVITIESMRSQENKDLFSNFLYFYFDKKNINFIIFQNIRV